MKKEFRVRKNEDFSRIIKKKQSMANRSFIIYYLKNDLDHARIGISVSKKLGKAVIRNKIKRQVRMMLQQTINFDDNYVEASVFFSKINGVYNDKYEYRKFVKTLKEPKEYVYFVDIKKGFEKLSKPFTNDAFSLSFILDSKGVIDKKSILQEKNYSISTLSKTQQTMILEKVEEIIVSNVFIDELNREDRIKGLYTALHMDKRFVHMINNFDYALINPKLIIYMEDAMVLDKEIGFLLLLLSKIGFDIIILSPGGDNSIENVISSKVIDIHRLDKMVYQFDFNEVEEENKSIFKKLFSKRGLF